MSSSTSLSEPTVVAGVVGRAHGLKGAFYVSHARAEVDYLADRTWRREESRLVA